MPERRVGRRESWWRPGCRYRAATGEPQRPDSGDELDRLPERRERALQYGATRVLDPRDTDIANAGLDVSAFVDASGSPHAVMSGIEAVRPAGTAVLVGLGSSEMILPIEHIQNLEITTYTWSPAAQSILTLW